MKKFLICLIALVLLFTTVSTSLNKVTASTTDGQEVQEIVFDANYEADNLLEDLDSEFEVFEDSAINIENIEVTEENVLIDASTEIDDTEVSLKVDTQKNEIELVGSYEKDGKTTTKSYDIIVTDIDGDDFSANFLDKETGEVSTYDTSEVSSSVLPYVVYFVGSQVLRVAVQRLAQTVVIKKIGTHLLSRNPLANIRYTEKVVKQMKQGDYHAFPRSVEAYGKQGRVKTITGGDGKKRKLVEIEGGYRGKDGVFEFIIEPDGKTVNHRLFKPKK